ncbi:MAG: hypothetical protein N2117_10380 [Anaerolineales bacterium]|nr:hypothetical protein [Anaerolineales bacterium]MCX7755633.1 hypothetical protein [Anaerolineales bacterium]MDW8279282.1 hypothetical protein [Anaerolineales bacterium]
MNRLLKFYLILVLSLAAGSTTFAVAYANLQPGSTHHEVRFEQLQNIHFTLAANIPQVQAVEFDLDISGDQIGVQFNSQNRTFPCTRTGSNHWYCTVQDMSLSDITHFRIILHETR